MKSLTQSPREAAFVQDPYRFYATAREAGPLFYWDDYDLICAPGFEAVDRLLRDRRFGREAPDCVAKPVPAHLKVFYDNERHSMLEREPPVHTRLRGQVMREFTGRKVNTLIPQIETLAHELIDRFPDGEFDLLIAFAEMLPVTIIARLLGVPDDMARQLLGWSHAMVAMYQARRDRTVEDAAVAATSEFSDYIRTLMDDRRRDPQDDMITALLRPEADLSEAEAISTIILLLNAGHEATVHTIGNGVAALLQHGHTGGAFRPEDQILRATNEILRFDPPLQMFTRYALCDVDMFGHSFKEGDEVGLMLASANRDGTVFERAEIFDPGREIRANASFGAGIHFCVGAPLARAELNVALPILFERCPDLRLSEPAVYADRYHFHGFERLMVTV